MRTISTSAFLILFFLAPFIHAQNASLVKDITPGTASSFVDGDDTIVGYVGDLLLFVLRDQSNISRLYSTGGTDASTLILHSSSSTNERFVNFVKADSTTMSYVLYDQQLLTYKLYTTNGVDTTQLNAHSPNHSINNLHFFQNHLYYNDVQYLRRIDLANTLDELVYQANDTIIDFYIASDSIYYAARTAAEDSLYLYNLTSQNKTQLGAIGHADLKGLFFNKVGNKLILFSNQINTYDSTYCYATDGSIGGTQLILKTQSAGYYFHQVYEGQIYFDTNNDKFYNSSSYSLWTSDGTITGTQQLNHLWRLSSAIVYNENLYFVAFPQPNPYNGDLLFNKDGSQTGGYQIYDGYIYYANAEPKGIITVNGKLYMSGRYVYLNYDPYGTEILEVKTDTNLSVNQRYTVYETIPGPSSYYNHYLCNTVSKIFFIGHDAATGMELYVFNPQSQTVLSITEEQNHAALFKCYPNPSSGILTLEYNGSDEIVAIQLKDISGKQIREFSAFTSLDLHDIEQGMYFLNIQLKNSSQVIKIIRQ
jgi:hypothetical protein